MRTILAILFLLFLPNNILAKENNIVCTYKASQDSNGYEELVPTSFSVTIEEDSIGNAISGSISEGGLCSYTRLSEYSSTKIRFDTCARPSWLSANDPTPEGFFEINRMTGEFTIYQNMSNKKNAYLYFFGSCRAGKAMF